MLLLILFAFIAGIVTILSPCILPVLPIVLSGSVSSGKQRPLGIVTGFILSFSFFTLFLSTLVSWIGISADSLRFLSVLIVVGFGVTLLIPQFQVVLESVFNLFSRFVPRSSGGGFMSGLIVGISLGLIWTPCVGPILAAVISLAITGSVSGAAALITVAYALGTALPMLAITYGGQRLLQQVPWLTRNTSNIQRVFGLIMIVTGIAIAMNWDRQFQTWVLTTFPQYGVGLTALEDNQLVRQQLDQLQDDSAVTDQPMGKPLNEMRDEMSYPVAPDFDGGTNWINSEPLSLEDDLAGRVVLVDFWTYSCINCIRTLPYLTRWHAEYADEGLVIVGVHSPEFEFEKNTNNVIEAMEDFGIEYPVVQDNDYAIWRAYNNRFWPAKYLIDKNGKIRYTHFGEGKYTETENMIRELLGEPQLETSAEKGESRRLQTKETYLGYLRAASYSPRLEIEVDQDKAYPAEGFPLLADAVGLANRWTVGPESVIAQSDDAVLRLNFLAQQVYLVLTPPETGSGTVQVYLDGELLPEAYRTADMDDQAVITIDEARKYDLLDLGEDYGRHTLELVFSDGVAAYAFTFGS